MVLAFFRGSPDDGGFDQIVAKAVSMLSDARHSFDLATLALLTDADASTVAGDVRDTDHRINQIELELRSDLVVHVSVQGTADIGSVLGFTLLLKKIERVGDQAKNILELAENGVDLAGRPETERLLEERNIVSQLFVRTAELMSDAAADEAAIDAFADEVTAKADGLQERIDGFMTSDRPGRDVVPLAIYDRYVRRILANLVGIVRASSEPVPSAADLPPGHDIDD